MNALQAANNLPVNQAALPWLEQADPELKHQLVVHVLALAVWAVQEGVPDLVVDPDQRHVLDAAVSSLTHLSPSQQVKFLSVDPDKASSPQDQLSQLEEQLKGAPDLRKAAQLALEWIAARLQRITPSLQAALSP
jgi:hypothetical protein